jgi:hypothetical protein
MIRNTKFTYVGNKTRVTINRSPYIASFDLVPEIPLKLYTHNSQHVT